MHILKHFHFIHQNTYQNKFYKIAIFSQRNLSRRGIATIRQVLDCRTIYIPGASIIVTHVRLFLSRSGQTTRLAYVVARTWTNVTSVIPLSVHRNIYLYSICVSVKRVAVSKFLLSHIFPHFLLIYKKAFMFINSTQA